MFLSTIKSYIVGGVIATSLVGAGLAAWHIHELRADKKQLQLENVAYEVQNQSLLSTVEQMERETKQANERQAKLSRDNRDLNSEIDRVLSIFREHDLTALSRAKPGMIETRANNATEELFNQINAETQPPK